MVQKISSKIGILLNWRQKDFDLAVAHEHIKKKTKYAWGTGGIQLRKFFDNDLLDEPILGLIKTSGQDEIIYGVMIDASKEFREYLNPNTNPKRKLHEKHKQYRPFDLKEDENRAFLFITDIFLLNKSIEFNKIKVVNGNVFEPRIYRSTVFFDIKKSGFNAEEILDKKKDFDDYSSIEEDEQLIPDENLEEKKKLRYHKFVERNPNLSRKAKEIHGYTCMTCGFNFEEKYGEIGRNYIEAHHIIPFAKLEKNVKISPRDDMAVVCANCHRMIHKFKNSTNINEFKEIIH